MTKKEVQQRVLKNGRPLDLDLFEWDEKTNTFSSNENVLMLDFRNVDSCTFKTGSNCTFDTGSNCTFKTNSSCTFKTGSNCTFDTGFDCIFKTGSNCTFDTGSNCTFDTGSDCVIVRRDVYEVIELEENQKIKLHDYGVKGFDIIDKDEEKKGKKVKICLSDNQIVEGTIIEE